MNLTNTLPADQRYSFVFEGTPQALDHVMINDVAQRYVQRYAVARSNSDFPDSAAAGLIGDPARPERNSDHDQPVAYFAFPGTPVVTLNGSATMNVEAYTSFVDPGATAHDDFGPLPVSVSGAVERERARHLHAVVQRHEHLPDHDRHAHGHRRRHEGPGHQQACWRRRNALGSPNHKIDGRDGALQRYGRRAAPRRARCPSAATSRSTASATATRAWTGRCSTRITSGCAPSARAMAGPHLHRSR